jgi:hypothetical protein
MSKTCEILARKLQGRDCLVDLAVAGRILLKLLLNKWGRIVGIGFI